MLAKQLSLTAMLSGAMLGGGVAASIGIALYYGIITFSRLRIVLQISNIFLLCLSAGLAGQAANFLAAADVLPELSSQLWDSAWLLSEHSFIGQLCAVLFGYSDHPTGIQMVFYGSTLALALAGYSYTNRIIAARRHA